MKTSFIQRNSFTVPGEPQWLSQQDGSQAVQRSLFGLGCIPASLSAGNATLHLRETMLKAESLQW